MERPLLTELKEVTLPYLKNPENSSEYFDVLLVVAEFAGSFSTVAIKNEELWNDFLDAIKKYRSDYFHRLRS